MMATYKNKDLTPFFPAGVRPARMGVYETLANNESGFQFWNGHNWRFWGFDIEDAERCKGKTSCFQKVQWRGLRFDPSEAGK